MCDNGSDYSICGHLGGFSIHGITSMLLQQITNTISAQQHTPKVPQFSSNVRMKLNHFILGTSLELKAVLCVAWSVIRNIG